MEEGKLLSGKNVGLKHLVCLLCINEGARPNSHKLANEVHCRHHWNAAVEPSEQRSPLPKAGFWLALWMDQNYFSKDTYHILVLNNCTSWCKRGIIMYIYYHIWIWQRKHISFNLLQYCVCVCVFTCVHNLLVTFHCCTPLLQFLTQLLFAHHMMPKVPGCVVLLFLLWL